MLTLGCTLRSAGTERPLTSDSPGGGEPSEARRNRSGTGVGQRSEARRNGVGTGVGQGGEH